MYFQLSLSHVLNMFITSFVSHKSVDSVSGNGGGGVTHNTAMLQLFLETYFTELLADAETTTSKQGGGRGIGSQHQQECRPPLPLDPDQVQALHTLVRSYLTSLTVPVRFVERNIDSNLYVARRVYLEVLVLIFWVLQGFSCPVKESRNAEARLVGLLLLSNPPIS